MDNLLEDIDYFIEDNDRDLKFRIGDEIYPINFESTPTIAYDFLNINDDENYSFHHPEFHNISSDEHPDKSDYNIYFDKVKKLCKESLEKSINESNHREHLKTINPNRKLLEVVKKIFKKDRLYAEQLPQFGEFGLYTNKEEGKAPRIFFFIGNAGIIYILLYDPFHKIFEKK